MNVVAETFQPMEPELVRNGIPTIDTVNKNADIWRPATSDTRKTPNTTNESASKNVVYQVTAFGSAV